MKFIFIDDSVEFCKVMRIRFKHMGIDAYVTSDPTDFIHKMEHEHYDYAFIDLIMPVDAGVLLSDTLKMYVNGTKLFIMTNCTALVESMTRNIKLKIKGIVEKEKIFEYVRKLEAEELQYA